MAQLRNMRGVVSCQQVIRELSAYFDRELTPHSRVTIEKHLRGCRTCTAVYDGVRNLLVLVTDNQNIIPLPRGFSNRLYHLLRK
jgi:predicted anti-sigma-YlaC factor YlaD